VAGPTTAGAEPAAGATNAPDEDAVSSTPAAFDFFGFLLPDPPVAACDFFAKPPTAPAASVRRSATVCWPATGGTLDVVDVTEPDVDPGGCVDTSSGLLFDVDRAPRNETSNDWKSTAEAGADPIDEATALLASPPGGEAPTTPRMSGMKLLPNDKAAPERKAKPVP
jgi:hypothetical protein